VTVSVNFPITISVADVSMCEGDNAIITAFASGGNGGPYNFTWLNDGSFGGTITVSPTADSIFTVVVSDGCSLNDTANATVTVDPYPLAGIKPSFVSGCKPASITFVDTIANIPNSSYFWDFGDGVTSTIKFPTHIYDSVGTFSVSLTVTSPNGCATSATSATVVVETCTGFQTLTGFENLSGLNIYPNPTDGLITFDIELSEAGDIEIQIYNVLGELLYNKVLHKIKKTTYEVDMERLTNGVYFVKLLSRRGSINKRIILYK